MSKTKVVTGITSLKPSLKLTRRWNKCMKLHKELEKAKKKYHDFVIDEMGINIGSMMELSHLDYEMLPQWEKDLYDQSN